MSKETGAKHVLDLGCGEGKLLRLLLAERQFETILGMDISWRTLETAKERLKLDELPERQRSRIELIQGSLTYRDQRLRGYDAAAIVEVIEHLDAPRLATFERNLFEFARPQHVVLTTPNAEYNAVFGSLPSGEFRHEDHRFEWMRPEFERWATEIGSVSVTLSASNQSGRKMQSTEHQHRWQSFPGRRSQRKDQRSRALAYPPGRTLRFRQIHFRPKALRPHGSRLLRFLPCTRF